MTGFPALRFPLRYMAYPHPIIAREGWPFIAATLVVALLTQVFAGWAWALLPWLAFIFCVQFFRDPPGPFLAMPKVFCRRPTGASSSSSRCVIPG